MQKQILPPQIQELQKRIESKLLHAAELGGVNTYFEPFKLKKVTLELDDEKLFAYDAEFQEFVNEDMKQRNKLSNMSKTIVTQGTFSSKQPQQ